MTLNEILDLYPDDQFLKADGFDDAIIGVDAYQEKLVYDVGKMIVIMMDDNQMSEEDAIDYLYFNVIGAYVGEQTPIFVKI